MCVYFAWTKSMCKLWRLGTHCGSINENPKGNQSSAWIWEIPKYSATIQSELQPRRKLQQQWKFQQEQSRKFPKSKSIKSVSAVQIQPSWNIKEGGN